MKGTRWQIESEADWPEEPQPEVTQLCLLGGKLTQLQAIQQVLDESGDTPRFIEDQNAGGIDWSGKWSEARAEIMARMEKTEPLEIPLSEVAWDRFPGLRRLYLWDVSLANGLPRFPTGLNLEVLELVNVAGITEMPDLPFDLQTLRVENSEAEWPQAGGENLSQLRELILRGVRPNQGWLDQVLRASAESLEFLDLSGCQEISLIREWPRRLKDIRMNGCEPLEHLPDSWPAKLRHLELDRVSKLKKLAPFPKSLDYVRISGMTGLATELEISTWPRTLFLYGVGLEIPRELHGEGRNENVARQYQAYVEEMGYGDPVENREVKLILLGDSRAGKTSLARRWVDNEFKADEKSTHAIRLWEKHLVLCLEGDDGASEILVNVWDFAGQDLYHSTHRLFLQSRAAFLLCETLAGDGHDGVSSKRPVDPLDVRRSVEYWQEQVNSLGKAPGRGNHAPRRVAETKIHLPKRPNAPHEVVDFYTTVGKCLIG